MSSTETNFEPLFEANSGPIVGITDKAVGRILESMAKEGEDLRGLRLSVTKGGCSGYEYSIKFAIEPEGDDLVYSVGELPVFVAPDAVEKLSGTQLDWADGMYGAGLKFSNPNAVHTCGCGASFATEEA